MFEYLKQLGLNENEQAVYISVIQAGKISPSRVAKETGINRTTVYSIARKLQGMGLITEDIGQKTAYLVAEDPERIIVNLEKEEMVLKNKKSRAHVLVSELQRLQGKATYSVPRIKFVDEGNLSDYLYQAYGRWCASAEQIGDNTWRGFQDPTFTKEFGDWIEWTWNQDSTGSLKAELFVIQYAHEKDLGKKFTRRNMKILPKKLEFDSSFWVAGEYIIMAQTRYKPFYLVEIHDSVMARNQRQLLSWLWNEEK